MNKLSDGLKVRNYVKIHSDRFFRGHLISWFFCFILPLSQEIYCLCHKKYIVFVTRNILPLSQEIYCICHKKYILYESLSV